MGVDMAAVTVVGTVAAIMSAVAVVDMAVDMAAAITLATKKGPSVSRGLVNKGANLAMRAIIVARPM